MGCTHRAIVPANSIDFFPDVGKQKLLKQSRFSDIVSVVEFVMIRLNNID